MACSLRQTDAAGVVGIAAAGHTHAAATSHQPPATSQPPPSALLLSEPHSKPLASVLSSYFICAMMRVHRVTKRPMANSVLQLHTFAGCWAANSVPSARQHTVQYRLIEERLFSLYHRCGRVRALCSHRETDGQLAAAVSAGHSGLTRQMVLRALCRGLEGMGTVHWRAASTRKVHGLLRASPQQGEPVPQHQHAAMQPHGCFACAMC